MQISELEPFRNAPFYMWAKDAEGTYLWGSAEMERFAGGSVVGRADSDFGPEVESPATSAKLQANDRHVLDSGQPLFTHERVESAGNVSVCKWPGNLGGKPVTFGIAFLVPGD